MSDFLDPLSQAQISLAATLESKLYLKYYKMFLVHVSIVLSNKKKIGDMSGMTGMHMRTTPSTSGNTAIVGKCAFFKISVYWNDGTPVTTLRPYLNAAGKSICKKF